LCRYGYQGSEKDDEVKGEGNSYTTHFRQYDARVGRWFSPDPKETKHPNESPYVAFHNNPIFYTDPRGDDPPEDLLKQYGNLFQKAWGESFSNKGKSREVFGCLIKKTTTEEIDNKMVTTTVYDVIHYHIASNGYCVPNYSNVPEGFEIVGDFHTHPYDSKEVEQLSKSRTGQVKFDGKNVPFSAGDFLDMGLQIGKGNLDNGDVSFVVTENVVYGIVITDKEKAEKFLKVSVERYGEIESKLINGTTIVPDDKTYADVAWDQIIALQKLYEETPVENGGGGAGESGVTFVKLESLKE
jgi:RHS repeat-associated protein